MVFPFSYTDILGTLLFLIVAAALFWLFLKILRGILTELHGMLPKQAPPPLQSMPVYTPTQQGIPANGYVGVSQYPRE